VLPDASSFQLERHRPPGELSGTWYSHKQPWARSAQPPGQTNPHSGKKEKENKLKNKQQQKRGWAALSAEAGEGQSLMEL
jgi:hypothetical protein